MIGTFDGIHEVLGSIPHIDIAHVGALCIGT